MTRMHLTQLFLKSTLAAFAMVSATVASAADVTIEIKNVESSEGQINVAVYDNEAGLNEGSSYRAIRQAAVEGTMEIVFKDMPAGEYGVMLYQDLNGNEKLDSNLLGIPKEPWSASLLGRSVFGKPGWADINFKLPDAGDRISIDMN